MGLNCGLAFGKIILISAIYCKLLFTHEGKCLKRKYVIHTIVNLALYVITGSATYPCQPPYI